MEDILQTKNVHDLCRLCLNENNTLQDVFDMASELEERSFLLIQKITDSTSIEILEEDELPTKICCECREQVEKMHEFKQKCIAIDALLRKHVRHKLQLEDECEAGTSSFSLEKAGTEYTLVPNVIDGELLSYSSEMLLEVKIKEEEAEAEISDGSSTSIIPDAILSRPKDDLDKSSKRNMRSSLEGSKFICQLCGKNFCNKYSLTRHEWSHSKKTISCQYCNKIFRNRESCLRHEKMHLEGNRYQCHMCDKSYVSSTSHAAHVRKHTGERPFKCSDCKESFYLISSFERHVAKHRGVKDYECEICSASFWVPDDLRAHVNRMH